MPTKSNGLNLKKLGIEKSEFGLALANYLGMQADQVDVKDASFHNFHPGSLYDVYNVEVVYSTSNNGNVGEEHTGNYIAKHFNQAENALDFDRSSKERRDLVTYEATISKNMGDYVPKHLYSNNEVLIMEYLGEKTLERIFLDKGKKKDEFNIELLEDLVKRIAGFHDKIERVVANNFRNALSKIDYQSKIETYLNQLWEGKTGNKGFITNGIRELVRDSFRPLNEMFTSGSVTGKYQSNQVIHQDLHPPHIFYKENEIARNPSFIDYQPVIGPVQFDLVDVLRHPIIFPYLLDGDKTVEHLLKDYMKERVRKRHEGLGAKIENGITIDDSAFDDFYGMFQFSRILRGARGASKAYSLEVRRPDIMERYLSSNSNYGYYRYAYLGDVENALQSLIGSRDRFSINDDGVKRLSTTLSLLQQNFRIELGLKNSLVERLGINQEDKI